MFETRETTETTTTVLPTQFYTAFLGAQKEMRDPVKDGANPHFRSKFVTLKGVLDAVRGPLHKHGITISQAIDVGENAAVHVVTTLAHTSGESITSRCPVICAKPNDPQALGSAITYARRYAIAAICGVAPSDDDDDGEAAAAPARKAAAPPAAATKPKAAAPRDDLTRALTPSEMSAVRAELDRMKPAPVVVSDLAEPFELAEEAVSAIRQAKTKAELRGLQARCKASKFMGEDVAIIREAMTARVNFLGNEVPA